MSIFGEQDINSKLKHEANQTYLKSYKGISLPSLECYDNQGVSWCYIKRQMSLPTMSLPASLTSVPEKFFPKSISNHIREKMARDGKQLCRNWHSGPVGSWIEETSVSLLPRWSTTYWAVLSRAKANPHIWSTDSMLEPVLSAQIQERDQYAETSARLSES